VSIQRNVPVLSLEAYHQCDSRERFISELYTSLSDYGFVRIKHHGIDTAMLENAYALNRMLFAQPEQEKLSYSIGSGGERGYTAFGREVAKGNTHADLKEFWHIGAEPDKASPYYQHYPKNVWPSYPQGFRECFTALYTQLHEIASQILDALGVALGLSPDYFPSLIQDGNSVLRLIHYPPVTAMNTQQHMRAAPHADINLLTLLVGASDAGLELQDRDGSWLPIEAKSGEIIVDTGDMMALLTNNILPATIHRVVNPDSVESSRYSMPFFLHPHDHAILSCLPECVGEAGAHYSQIRAGDFLHQRLKENGLKK